MKHQILMQTAGSQTKAHNNRPAAGSTRTTGHAVKIRANSNDRLSTPLTVPPKEKTTARDDQAGQISADGGARNATWETRQDNRLPTHGSATALWIS